MNNIILNKDNNYLVKIKKIIVNYTLVIFGFIIVLIFLLLGLYYLTPNNYLLIEWNNNFKLVNTIEYILKPKSNSLVNFVNNAKYLRFSETINLVVKNNFKSQNIIINKNIDLIESKYNSEIFMVNNLDIDKKIIVQFYSII